MVTDEDRKIAIMTHAMGLNETRTLPRKGWVMQRKQMYKWRITHSLFKLLPMLSLYIYSLMFFFNYQPPLWFKWVNFTMTNLGVLLILTISFIYVHHGASPHTTNSVNVIWPKWSRKVYCLLTGDDKGQELLFPVRSEVYDDVL